MIYRGTIKDGVVELEEGAALPEGTQVKVELVARQADEGAKEPESLGWPPGYFGQTFGSISDETFVRPPQGGLPDAVDSNDVRRFPKNELRDDQAGSIELE